MTLQYLGPYASWVRETRPPTPMPPPRSCDCQLHIFGDPSKYPPKHKPIYEPPQADFEDAKGVLKILGFDRAVIVYPMPYGTDNRYLFDTLQALTPAERARYRAVCTLTDEVTDNEILRLKELGLVGARFNIGKKWNEGIGQDMVRRNLERTHALGLHARLHIGGEDIDEWGGLLRSIKGLTFVIDHMGSLDFELGLDQPAMHWYREVLKDENWWMMISNGNRLSPMEEGWDDAVPFGRALVEAAPDKLVWGTDWPHVVWPKRMMNDAEPLELFYRYIDNDPALMRQILVETPAKLHGFP